MLLALSVSVLLGAAPTLASPDFSTLNVPEATARFCNEHLAAQLETRGIRVTTARQIAALLGMERQRQLSGCAEDGTSCMAELAAALGTDGVLLGDLGKVGSKYQVNLRIARSNGAGVVATWTRTVSSEDELLGALTDAARELAPKLVATFNPGAVVKELRVVRSVPVVPSVAFGVLAVAGGVLLGVSASSYGQLTSRTPGLLSADQVDSVVSTGEWTRAAGIGSLIGAGVALGVGVVLYLLSGHEEPVATLLGVVAPGLSWGLR